MREIRRLYYANITYEYEPDYSKPIPGAPGQYGVKLTRKTL